MSVSNDNIKLSITTGEGISQAIDRQLDTEYNQDITLKRSEWNTIFEIVRNDQATQNKQYTGSDTDIGNSGHFIVKEGFYELTQNAWNQIKNIVNAKLGIVSGDVNTKGTEAPANENPTPETETDEQAVTRILSEAGIEVDANTLAQVVQKYPTMQAIETAGLTLEERVVNYARGLNFDKFGLDAANTIETGDFQSDCSKATTSEELKNAYLQFGREFVEVYDKDNDGKINCHEMFYRELIANYIDNGFSETEATAKAIETVEKYRQYSVLNMPTDETFESILFGNIVNKIAMHETEGETPDFAMSACEAGAHLMSMAKLVDTKNNITGEEYRFSQLAILYSDYSVEEIMADGYTQEQANAIFNLNKKYENNLPAYTNFLKS